MKITSENLLEYFTKVQDTKKEHDCLRWGQTYINVFQEMFPLIDPNLYVGKPYDCFYNDSKIPLFLEFINTLID